MRRASGRAAGGDALRVNPAFRRLWTARAVSMLGDAVTLASYLFGALLLELTDPRTRFVVAGGGGLLATVVAVVGVARARRHGDTDHGAGTPRPRSAP